LLIIFYYHKYLEERVAFLLAIKVVVSYGKAEVEEKHSVVVPERLISLLGYARQENS